LSDALQGARLRGRDLGQSVREHARGIASRTQQLEEVLVGTLQSNLSASEMEAKLESDAKKLWRPAQAAEVLQRWLVQMRNSETRYLDISTAGSSIERLGPGAEPAQLTFHQVFLRSRALELTVDTVARASKLRSALREHALPPPELWPEERQFPAAFAQAFVALLEATIGPREQWFGTLHALLSSEKYADEQCHVWLVQLLSGLRQDWQWIALEDRARELRVMEEASSEGLKKVRPGLDVSPSPETLSLFVQHLQHRGAAAAAAYRTRKLQRALEADYRKAASQHEEHSHHVRERAAAIAAAAAEHATMLDSTAMRRQVESQEVRGTLRRQSSDFREELVAMSPVSLALEREIEEAEVAQRELQMQLKQMTERLDALRQKRTGAEKKVQQLHSELSRVEGAFAQALAHEDDSVQESECRRALASAVSELALGLATVSPTPSTRVSQDKSRSDTALATLAESEIERLSLIARAAEACLEVADDRTRRNDTLAQWGVATESIEADVVGEAGIVLAAHGVLVEMGRCRDAVEFLRRQLLELADGVAETGCSCCAEELNPHSLSGSHAQALANSLQDGLAACDAARPKLDSLIPQNETANFSSSPSRNRDPAAFLNGTSNRGTARGAQELDPFLLEDLGPETSGREATSANIPGQLDDFCSSNCSESAAQSNKLTGLDVVPSAK